MTKTIILGTIIAAIIISAGVGTASALIVITLAGNVVVTGDMDVQGGITGPTVDNLQTQINSLAVQAIPIATQNQIDNIEGKVASPTFGLEAIESEIVDLDADLVIHDAALTAHDGNDLDVTVTQRGAPGILVSAGTGVVTITCDNFINGSGDIIRLSPGGTVLTLVTGVATTTIALNGQTLTWVQVGPQDAGICVAALLS